MQKKQEKILKVYEEEEKVSHFLSWLIFPGILFQFISRNKFMIIWLYL